MFKNLSIQNIVNTFTHINIHLFVFLATLSVLLTSIPIVYIIAKLFSEPYSTFLFGASIVVPGFIAPVIFYQITKMLNRLSQFQDKLHEATEENKKKELMLYEQARFAFMGEMLSNISHQWRQPLHTINLAIFSAKTEAMQKKLSDEHLMKIFDLIESNTHHLSNTIDDFKQFFQKRDTHELRTLDEILIEVQNVVSPILKYNSISLHVKNDCVEDVYLTSPISQVLLNLIGNSIDALKSVSQEKKEITINCSTMYNMLDISCCDNGCGIDDDIVQNIFDPYFTTKSKAQGTGIGLYMSRQIIEKMYEGRLVISPHSHSTCFKMRLKYQTQREDS